MVSPARGGILCEELGKHFFYISYKYHNAKSLGTGKTIMILTLVIATICEISSPEESLQDDRPVMTPVAFRHFPSVFEMTRKRLLGRRSAKLQSGEFPSLVELLLHHSRTSPYTCVPDLHTDKGAIKHQKRQELEERFELTQLSDIHRANAPFYLHYENGEGDIRASRKTIKGPRLMYLTTATLIVVPVNLLSQWDREITKHCEYPLRVLIIRAGTPTPSARSLASDYDVRTFKLFLGLF